MTPITKPVKKIISRFDRLNADPKDISALKFLTSAISTDDFSFWVGRADRLNDISLYYALQWLQSQPIAYQASVLNAFDKAMCKRLLDCYANNYCWMDEHISATEFFQYFCEPETVRQHLIDLYREVDSFDKDTITRLLDSPPKTN